MAHSNSEIKILTNLQISPPPGSVPTTSLPLTFFDIPWLLCRPIQRLFFYQFPHSTLHFLHQTLPSLTHSLSLTLQHFYPLAATLRCPPPPHTPFILFTGHGESSVPFTVAESTADFHQLIANNNHPRSVTDLHPYIPKLPPPLAASPEGVRAFPILALQVVVFPNSGICIGAEYRHAAADGMSLIHFVKSWGAIFRSGGLCLSPPCHDRALIRDPNDLESVFMREWWNCGSHMGSNHDQEQLLNKVRATYLLTQPQLQNLKNWAARNCDSTKFHISTFVIVCAFVWACMVKAKLEQENEIDEKICHFSFVADCRNRLGYKIPTAYFANCLAICYTCAKEGELIGEGGIIVAVKAIGGKIKELGEDGVLNGAEEWMSKWKEVSENGSLITVAGSPKLRVYDADFGWGRLKKSEMVQIDVSGAIYVCESGGDDDGGIEIGLALTKDQMEVFNAVFHQNLKKILN